MRFLFAAGKAFLSAFVAVVLAMLTSYWLGLAPFQAGLAFAIATSIAIAFGIKEQWQLPQGASSLLAGLLAGFGSIAAHLLSTHA